MQIITLPDGSRRTFDRPVTVAEVAADMGRGLARAALAGELDGRAGRYGTRNRRRREASDHHIEGPRAVRGENAGARMGRATRTPHVQSLTLLSLSAFPMTDTELRLIAAAAIIGESSNPKNG